MQRKRKKKSINTLRYYAIYTSSTFCPPNIYVRVAASELYEIKVKYACIKSRLGTFVETSLYDDGNVAYNNYLTLYVYIYHLVAQTPSLT